jgi:hypothetical protein
VFSKLNAAYISLNPLHSRSDFRFSTPYTSCYKSTENPPLTLNCLVRPVATPNNTTAGCRLLPLPTSYHEDSCRHYDRHHLQFQSVSRSVSSSAAVSSSMWQNPLRQNRSYLQCFPASTISSIISLTHLAGRRPHTSSSFMYYKGYGFSFKTTGGLSGQMYQQT